LHTSQDRRVRSFKGSHNLLPLAKLSVHPLHLVVVSNSVERDFSDMLCSVCNLVCPELLLVCFVKVRGSVCYEGLRLFSRDLLAKSVQWA
jgi:hypothetical protein